MTAWDHDCVDRVCHADLAQVRVLTLLYNTHLVHLIHALVHPASTHLCQHWGSSHRGSGERCSSLRCSAHQRSHHLRLVVVADELRVWNIVIALGQARVLILWPLLREAKLEGVCVGGLAHVIEHKFWVLLVDAAVLEEVCNLCILHSHVN